MLAQRGLAVVRRPPLLCHNPNNCLEITFDHVLCHYLLRVDRVPYFLQIGAFDGVSGDPLHFYVRRGLLKGCLLEPQTDAFQQLCANYAGCEGLTFKQAAIGVQSGTAALYRVRPGTTGPEWLYQIASFDKDMLLKHAAVVPGLEQAVVVETVPVVAFDELFAELRVAPDIVVIDTEGYDFEVIKLLNVPMRKPSIIQYEYVHLRAQDQHACLELLASLGYVMAKSGSDMVAYLAGALAEQCAWGSSATRTTDLGSSAPSPQCAGAGLGIPSLTDGASGLANTAAGNAVVSNVVSL
jgi:FkbM family methyltransferase